MKKVLLSLVAAAAMTFGYNTTATAQVEEGNVIIDLYYGYPNSSKTFWSVFETASVEGYKSTGIGPLGARFEYMIADNLGVGIEGNYVAGGATYTETFSVYNSTDDIWEDQTYNYELSTTKIRVMARMNYHFVTTDVVDAYVGFGAGYKHKKTTWTTEDPNFDSEFESGLNLVPVAVRIAVGSRFFFTENIGVNMELGLGGGPLVAGGLSVKF